MIDFENVSKIFGKNVKAVRNLNLHIDNGEFVFVMGDSGSGKSTLIRLLLKEIEPTSGIITVDGENIVKMKRRKVPYYRRKLGVVFQDFKLLRDRNVFENVAFAQRVLGKRSRQIRQDVPQILTRVGLSAKYKAFPGELSGGEQQRVAIARALVNKPDILLCDEPTGNLDEHNAWEVMQLLERINEEGTTVVMVTHSREIVERMNKRVIVMNRGDMVNDRHTPRSGDTWDESDMQEAEGWDEDGQDAEAEGWDEDGQDAETEGWDEDRQYAETESWDEDRQYAEAEGWNENGQDAEAGGWDEDRQDAGAGKDNSIKDGSTENSEAGAVRGKGIRKARAAAGVRKGGDRT